MESKIISIKKARVHNLKNISVDIPKNKLVVITGLSGSGKSSLAFDTIYAEGQRRYVESLSAYARQFLGVMDKPDVDHIDGLSPAISIDQKSVSKNPRSTVGTITEIYDYLRLLFARVGKPHCPKCARPVSRQNVTQITDQILKLPKGTFVRILAPVIKDKKGEHREVLEAIERAGYIRVRIDGEIIMARESLNRQLGRYERHNIEAVVDKFTTGTDIDRSRIAESTEAALKLSEGVIIANLTDLKSKKEKDEIFSEHFACLHCGLSIQEIEPRTFSFNSPHGACAKCTGLGKKLEVDPNLVVPNPRLTIGEGAIKPWATASHRVGRQGWYWWKLEDLSHHLKFSMSEPWSKISEKAKKTILSGIKEYDFEGVIPNLERRWAETDSDFTRAEIEKYMIVKICPKCEGKRLKPEALAVIIEEKNIADLTSLTITEAHKFFAKLSHGSLNESDKKIARPIIKEVLNRLDFLLNVGLDYLTLGRESETLAGGEAQRIRLATQIGSQLTGVLYILDEPSVGLHARDHNKLLTTLKELKDLGNSVIVVEHDGETINQADWILDVGPQAGEHGGKIVFEGTPSKLKQAKTLTGQYLSGRKKIESPKEYRRGNGNHLIVKGCQEHNLKNIDVKIPLGVFICISGVSGSGKSTFVDDILAKALAKHFYRAKGAPGAHKKIEGLKNLDKVVYVDQSPIGRTPRSNPATYTNIFTYIRDLFSQTQEAKIRGYRPGRFSFNVKGGRCEVCEGQGVKKIEMQFLPDVYIECEECHGHRFNKEALEIEYKGKNIADILEMSVEEAFNFFKNLPPLKQKLGTLKEVGLGYMKLGQPAPTLSGGEAQRVKLATELSRRDTGRTLYILDEPTTGLHFDDIGKLLNVLHKLTDKGNTVLVIEHNLDVLKTADWIIDLGPEGGGKGGEIVVQGTPKDIMKIKKSYTGQWLKKVIKSDKK
jgi:excinuclease ABC subunit A